MDLIQFTLDNHADVNIQFVRNRVGNWYQGDNVTGDTPLHIAVRTKNIQFVSILLKYHPNLSLRNQNYTKETVLDIAKKRKSNEIIELIEKEHRHQIYMYLSFQWTILEIPKTK